VVVVYTSGFDWWIAGQDACITNLVLCLAGYEMIVILRYYQPRPLLRFIWSIGLALVCMALVQWLLELTLHEKQDYLAFVQRWFIVRGLFAWLIISFITVMSWMYFYMQEQQDINMRNVNTEKLAREAELSSLRQQLQPHFLFNSLNSISALAGSRPEEARKMIQQLSDFLRGTIKRDNQQMVTLDDELTHLQLYLDIEKVRFGHRLKTEVTQKDETHTLLIPSLLLQPIVENAIKFGLYETTGEILIRIVAEHANQQLIVSVENPYDGESTQPRQGTGFGLSSVQRRLYLLFGRNDLLSVSKDEKIFTTKVLIPQTL
jgi:two-component system, LytTR family, sensor kinase